jgi:hypothetical protein
VGGDVSVDNESLLVIDFVNLKIKLTQSFRDAHRDRVFMCVHKSECSYMYEYLRLYCVSKIGRITSIHLSLCINFYYWVFRLLLIRWFYWLHRYHSRENWFKNALRPMKSTWSGSWKRTELVAICLIYSLLARFKENHGTDN